MRKERKDLFYKAFSLNTCNRYIPIDIWDKTKDKDDAFNIMPGTNDQGVFLALFNWNNEELNLNHSNIPTDKIKFVFSYESTTYEADNNVLKVKLKALTSVIFHLYEEAQSDIIRIQIVYSFN